MSRVALVAGATGGIGLAVADLLGANGYAVARLSRSVKPESTPTSLSVPCDVTDRASVISAVEKVVAHFGCIDLLVNAVGVATTRKVTDLSAEDLDSLFKTNVLGALWLYQSVVEKMKMQACGYVIHIGSLRADAPGTGKAGYCASKAAATQLTRVLAKECKDMGIRVTTIHPGYVNSKVYKGASQKIPFTGVISEGEAQISYFAETVEAEDIGKMVLCLDSLSSTAVVDEIRMGRLWGN